MEGTQAPKGKGLAITGFVLGLVAVVIFWIISPIAILQAAFGGGYVLSVIWLVLSLAAAVLSFMGMKAKKGLAITGLILGIVGILLSAWLIYGVNAAQAAIGDTLNQGLDQLGGELQNSLDALQDSLQ